MSFISVFFIILYVLVCIFLILVVLLQQGKGADLAGAFGGGGSQTSFGPRTSANIMHQLTTISFVVFVILSMGLAILAGKHRGASVVADEPTPTPVTDGEKSGGPSVGADEDQQEASTEIPAEDGEAAAQTEGADAQANPAEDAPAEEAAPAAVPEEEPVETAPDGEINEDNNGA